MYIYYYEIEYYDDFEGKMDTAIGVVPAGTLIQALEEICSWYGERNVNQCKLEYVNQDDGSCIEIQELRKFFSDKNKVERKEK